MLGRRDLIRAGALGLLLGSTGGLMEACGSDGGTRTTKAGGIELVSADRRRAAGDPDLLAPTVRGMAGFAERLYGAAATGHDNLIISPYSVSVALSMTLAGARGQTATQLRRALGADPLGERWALGMNTLTAYVDGLAGPTKRADGSKAEIGLATANALFGQRGLTWERAFLDLLAEQYGAGLRTVDFAKDPDGVARLIDAWVADRTDNRITDLIPPGALTPDTRLALVNAVSLTAPWEEPFSKGMTKPGPFHLDSGKTVQADLMTKSGVGVSLVDGAGWSAVRIPYAGSTLAMTAVVPEQGRLGAVEGDLAAVLAAALGEGRSSSVTLTLPRWTSRTSLSLESALATLGVTDAFDRTHADFSGMTTQERLYVGAVLHQGYIAVDEDGTEAAAATAVTMRSMAAAGAPETFVVDRPFLYVLHDTAHGTPLFLGRVTDPTQ